MDMVNAEHVLVLLITGVMVEQQQIQHQKEVGWAEGRAGTCLQRSSDYSAVSSHHGRLTTSSENQVVACKTRVRKRCVNPFPESAGWGCG